MEIKIEGSLETLSEEEWRRYFSVSFFDNMHIDEKTFGVSANIFQNLSRPLLYDMILEHNNKVGKLHITYALCMHYFDKGIPDDPWYISPGKEGQSIQYFPEFQEEHYMRQFWFGYFADTYYLRMSAIWDSLIEIINYYYGLGYKSDIRLKKSVRDWLKDNQKDIYDQWLSILQEPIYKEAQKYRTMAAHGTSPSLIQGMIKQKNVKAERVVSVTAGEYTNVASLKRHMEKYAIYTGNQIKEIIAKMVS